MRHVRALRPAALAVVLSAAVSVWPAHGQTVIGGDGQPSVEIDLGVLNSLGPAPTVPDLLRPTLPYNMRAFPRGADTSPVLRRQGYAGSRMAVTAVNRVPDLPPISSATPGAASAPMTAPASPPPAARTVPQAASVAPPPAIPSSAAAAPPPRVSVPAAPRIPERPQVAIAAPPPPAVPTPPAAAAPQASAPAVPVSAPATPPPPPAAAPKPAAAAPPPKSEPPVQTASRTPPPAPSAPSAAAAGDTMQIAFSGEDTSISDAGQATLNKAVQKLQADEQTRVQLLAYATVGDDSASRARRLSLSRALAVRAYLMSKGVRSTRMDVRALGNLAEGNPRDRVDVVIVAR